MVRPTSGEPTAALERLADGLLAADEEWRVTYADDRAVELLDLGGGNPAGRHLWSALEGEPGGLEAVCRRASRTGERTTLRTRLPGSGEAVSVEVHPSETGVTLLFREGDGGADPQVFDRLLEVAPVAVAVLDGDGEVIRANERAVDLFGPGGPADADLYDEDGDPVPDGERPHVRAAEEGGTVRGRFRIEDDGESRRIEVSAEPVRRDAGGNRRVLLTASATAADPSERDRAERTADRRVPDGDLTEVLERVSGAFFAVDEDWRFTYLNGSAEELLDVDAGTVRGNSVWEEFPEAVGTTFEREYRRAMEEQEPVSFESYYPPLEAWFEVDAYPSESGLSVYFRDVSERKLREEELERQRDALERHREDLERLVDVSAVAQDVTREALRAGSRTEVESLVCETLAGTSFYDAAWIGAAGPDGSVEFRTGAGLDEEALRRALERGLDGELPTVTAALRRGSVKVQQNLEEIDDPRRESFADRGIRSMITLPLGHGDRSYGVLTVETTRKRAFTGVERDVLGGMAETVSRAIEAAERRQRYRSLVEDVLDEGADVGISVVDEDGRIIWFNEALEAHFGVDRAAVLGRDATDAVHEVLRWEVETPVRISEVEDPPRAETAPDTSTDLRVERGEDGAERFLEFRSVDLGAGLYAGGRVEIYTDVTDRTLSKRALAERERMWSTLIDNLPGTVYRCRNERGWPMEFVSGQVEALTGYPAERFESGGVSWGGDVVHPQDREPLAESVDTAVSAGESFRETYRIRTADGEVRWVREQGSPVGDGGGEAEFLEGFINDVTEREWAHREQELVEALTRETATADTLEEALLTVVERVCEATGWDHGEAWTPDHEGRLTLAARTRERSLSPFREVSAGTVLDPGEGHVGHVYASGETEHLPLDGAGGRSSARIEAAREAGLGAAVGVPVTSEDGTVAVLTFYLEDGLPVPDRMVEAVETVGSRLGEVLAYRRAEMYRRRSERERERLVRINRLIRRITGALVAAESHEEIEETVCRRLVEHDSYVFAWYGEPEFGDEGTVEPRTCAGREEGYLEEVDVAFDDGETGRGPAGRAIRSGTVIDCPDIRTEEAFEPWREPALERGFRSAVAVPVSYGEARYGVLCVYAETPGAFSGEERSVFAELGDAIGHAKNAIYRKEGLLSDARTQLEFRFPSPIPDSDLPDETDGLTVEETTTGSDGELVHFVRTEGMSAEDLATFVEESPSCTGYRRLGGEDADRYAVRQAESDLVDLLSTYGGQIRSLDLDRDGTRVVVELPQRVDVREFVDTVREQYPDATLGAQRTVDREPATASGLEVAVTSTLTDKQREALEVAYHSGYFEWPRESDGEAVAETLGVSPSTFHQHLRAAERKLAGVAFGGHDD